MEEGTKEPFSRKAFMFAIVRREEAEGDRRIMGSRERDLLGDLLGVEVAEAPPLAEWPERWGRGFC